MESDIPFAVSVGGKHEVNTVSNGYARFDGVSEG
jgi:hypothetical protein